MRTPSSTTTAARFLLLGDSHAGAVGRAATAAGVPFHGGPMGAGREFTASFFDVRDGVLTFREEEPERLYRGFLAELGVSDLAELTVPVVATFGFSVHFYATAENWRIYRDPGGSFPPGFLDGPLFDAIVRAMARDAIAFYRYATGLGLRVLALPGPQRVPVHSDPTVFLAAQDVLLGAVAATGAEVVDLRHRVTGASGFQRPELCEPDDPIHGNLAFGRLIVADLLDRGL